MLDSTRGRFEPDPDSSAMMTMIHTDKMMKNLEKMLMNLKRFGNGFGKVILIAGAP